MARLPTRDDLSGPASLRSGRRYATADTTAGGQGLAALGAGISRFGEQQVQQQNTVDIARAEAAKTEGLLTAQNEFDYDPDFATYTKRAPERTGKVVNEAANLIRDPKMRERWKINAQTDALRVNDGIYDSGIVKERQALVAGLTESADTNYKIYTNPDTPEEVRAKARADIQGSIDMAERSGLIDPQKAFKARKDFLEGGDLQLGLLIAERDPYTVLGTPRPAGVIQAIKTVETGGERDPARAVSSAGAVGSMQVMPGTAREIGAELNDPFWRTDPDPEQVSEYLKRDDVSERYGTHYFNKMLSRYDGDLDAALIAYNGGPGRADAWLASGRDDSVIPKESADYYKKVTAQMGGEPTLPQRAGPDLPVIVGNAKGLGRISQPDVSGVRPDVMDRFKAVQNAFGTSVPIVSGFRDPARNAAAGGAKKSQHMHGNALDLDVSKMSEADRVRLIKTASEMGFTGIGVYTNSIHLDTGGRRVWGPSYKSASVPGWAQGAVAEHLGRKDVAAPERPEWFQRLAPADREKVIKAAERRSNELAVEARGAIEVAIQNAPVAFQNTGRYDGALPTPEQFFAAYGPQDGAQRYNAFQAAVETSQSAYDMRTMPAGEIQQMLAAATPDSSGNDAALETKRYEALSKAAESTLKVRKEDPSTYVQQTFPAVRSAWEAAGQDPAGVQNALAVTAAAQRQLGIGELKLLPDQFSDNAVKQFKNENVPAPDRVASISNLVFATGDKEQRRAIFNQLVASGLPEIAEGALQAVGRGDQGAARRLFEAAMTDPSKLPGKAPATTAEINEAIQGELFEEGRLGDVYYGLTDGTTENVLKAQRDATLLRNAVELRVRRGDDLSSAVTGAARDLFGDVEVVSGTSRVGAELLLPRGTDAAPIIEGLGRAMPDVRRTLRESMTIPGEIAGEGRAIADAVVDNYVERVMAEGYFRNVEDGFAFFDPIVGAPVSGADGRPLIFTERDLLSRQVDPQRTTDPTAPNAAPLTDDAFEQFQQRMMGDPEAQPGETMLDAIEVNP